MSRLKRRAGLRYREMSRAREYPQPDHLPSRQADAILSVLELELRQLNAKVARIHAALGLILSGFQEAAGYVLYGEVGE